MVDKGPVQILAEEINAPFVLGMERVDVLARFVAECVAEFDHHLAIEQYVKGVPSDVLQVLSEIKQLLAGPHERDALLSGAALIGDRIHQIDDDDGWPTSRHLNTLLGFCLALRFGLEQPCLSRWPAEAATNMIRERYGFRLFDRHTAEFERGRMRELLSAALQRPSSAVGRE